MRVERLAVWKLLVAVLIFCTFWVTDAFTTLKLSSLPAESFFQLGAKRVYRPRLFRFDLGRNRMKSYGLIRPPPSEDVPPVDEYMLNQVSGYERLIIGKARWKRMKQAEFEAQHSLHGDQDADGVDDIPWISGVVTKIAEDGAEIQTDEFPHAFLPNDEFSLARNVTLHDVVKVGDTVRGEHIATRNNSAILSLKRPQCREVWKRMHDYRRKTTVTRGLVTKVTLTGLIVRVWGFHAVIPRNDYGGMIGKSCLGKVIPLKFKYVHWRQQRILATHKAALLSVHIDKFSIGQLIEGIVERLIPYGVLIKTRWGIPAVIPQAQISQFQVTDPNALFRPQQYISAVVIGTDMRRGQLTLSTKLLEPSPGDMLQDPKMVFAKAAETVKNIPPEVIQEMVWRARPKLRLKSQYATYDKQPPTNTNFG